MKMELYVNKSNGIMYGEFYKRIYIPFASQQL